MNASIESAVKDFIDREKLPDDYLDTVRQWFFPMTEQLLQNIAGHQGTFVVGISGSQGSGKSTLADLLVILLREMMGLKAVNLSIDDFYLTRRERQALAAEVHPLLATRGVPGTHDVDLAVDTIEALKGSGEVAVPRFNKAVDDRAPRDEWPRLRAPVDVVVLEGWCLCIDAQAQDALERPVNELERSEDADGEWRRYVNERIAGEYQRLYGLIDYLIMLRAPSFDKVYEWRQHQEDRLAERERGRTDSRVMTPQQVRRFIQHYERVTRHGLETLPRKADRVFELTDEQRIRGEL